MGSSSCLVSLPSFFPYSVHPLSASPRSAPWAIDLFLESRPSRRCSLSSGDFDAVNAVLADLEDQCRAFIDGPGAGSLDQTVEFSVEARYAHQIWEIEVPLRVNRFASDADVTWLKEDFHATHREIFAIDDPESERPSSGQNSTYHVTFTARSS